MLAGLLALDAAAWSVWQLSVDEGYEICLEEPRECAGQRFVLPLQRVYEIVGSAGQVGRPEGRVRVMGDLSGVRIGDEVSVTGTFSDGGWLLVEEIEPHPLRPGKRRLGVLGVAVLALLLPLVFTLRRWRPVPRGASDG